MVAVHEKIQAEPDAGAVSPQGSSTGWSAIEIKTTMDATVPTMRSFELGLVQSAPSKTTTLIRKAKKCASWFDLLRCGDAELWPLLAWRVVAWFGCHMQQQTTGDTKMRSYMQSEITPNRSNKLLHNARIECSSVVLSSVNARGTSDTCAVAREMQLCLFVSSDQSSSAKRFLKNSTVTQVKSSSINRPDSSVLS